jgi:hypothetical protein
LENEIVLSLEKSLTNLLQITEKLYHKMLYRIHLTRDEKRTQNIRSDRSTMITLVDVNPTSKIAANDGVTVHVQWHILWSFMAFLNWNRCVFSVCYGLSIEHIAIIDWSTGFSPVPCRQMFKTPLSRTIVYMMIWNNTNPKYATVTIINYSMGHKIRFDPPCQIFVTLVTLAGKIWECD